MAWIEGLVILAGIVLILALADIIVKRALRLGLHFGWTGAFVGLTILSIGTSIPEIMSAVVGSIDILVEPSKLATLSGLIIGQNVGSDIFQQSIILSVVGIVGTVVVVRRNLLKEMGALIAGALLVLVFSLGGIINRVEGFLLLGAYGGYLLYLSLSRKHKKVKPKHHLTKKQVWLEILLILFLFVLMGIIANNVLQASTKLVALLPVSASFFGIILLGVASALPELTTALVAVFKKNKGVSAGVLIGSNITNPLMGLGLGALISTYVVPDVVVLFDLPFKIGTALLISYFLFVNERLEKWEALTLIGLFVSFLLLRLYMFPVDF